MIKPFRSGQRKAFYMQRTPEPNCTRKELVDIDRPSYDK